MRRTTGSSTESGTRTKGDPVTLSSYIREKQAKHSPLLMTHAVVGYPSLEDNWTMLQAMADAGVDLVELQMPFSEPIADGPLFVKANQAAIERGLRRDDYFDLVERAAKAFEFPVLFMGYYNTVFRMGHDVFCERLATVGARGFIIADLPPEEATDLIEKARTRELNPILIMTPTNSEARLAEIACGAEGFVYCVARKGVTGRRTDLELGVTDFLARCRRATDLPLALGFGIKTPEDVRSVRPLADVAIVGTACLEAWETRGETGYREFLGELAAAAEPQEPQRRGDAQRRET